VGSARTVSLCAGDTYNQCTYATYTAQPMRLLPKQNEEGIQLSNRQRNITQNADISLDVVAEAISPLPGE